MIFSEEQRKAVQVIFKSSVRLSTTCACHSTSARCVLHDKINLATSWNDVWYVAPTLQEAWKRIGFPHAFASPPRHPVRFLARFKMEETANLLWVGHMLAKHGLHGFQQLWSLVRPAATHYIYGISASHATRQKTWYGFLPYYWRGW
jgi:hypothetical protein